MDFGTWKRRPDAASLSHLLESVEPRVQRICRRILRDPHDAEEARQEVLLEIASGLEAIVDGAHFDRWVGKIAFRTALDRRRMRLRRIAREHEAAGRASNGATRDDELHESMSRLDEDDRGLLIERYFDRRTLREMGDRRGISAVAARKRLAGAQDRLKRMLGGAIPIALVVGASAVKAKMAAVLAVVLLALTIGGVWMTASRRSSTGAHQARTTAAPVEVSTNSADSMRLEPQSTDPSEDPQTIRRSAEREKFIQNMKRYRAMGERSRECGREGERLMRAGTWSEELTKEMQQLEKDMPALYREMMKQVALHPDICMAYFNELEWTPEKSAIGRLLIGVVQEEMVADDSQTGPVLRALLPLARGSAQDRTFLLRFAKSLRTGVPELAELCFEALEDSNPEDRYSAMSALSLFAEKGNLREYFVAHQEKLKEIAKAGTEDRPAGFAFLALAGAETPDSDEFILGHWTTARTLQQFHECAAAMVRIAPRVAASQEHRIAPALLQAFDVDGGVLHPRLFELAFRLSKEKCVEVLRVAVTRVPQMEPGMAQGLENIIARIEAGESEAVGQEFEKMVRQGAVTTYAIRTVGRVDLKSLK